MTPKASRRAAMNALVFGVAARGTRAGDGAACGEQEHSVL